MVLILLVFGSMNRKNNAMQAELRWFVFILYSVTCRNGLISAVIRPTNLLCQPLKESAH